MRRIRSRAGNGRFRRATLENTFGLKAWACAACRRFVPRAVGEGKPTSCPHCHAEPFVDIGETSP